MTYTEIIISLRLRRQNTHDALTILKRKSLVHEDGGAQWKPGKKKSYSLTDKGRKYLTFLAVSETEKALGLLKEMLNLLEPLKRYQVFEELRAYMDAKEIEDFEKILNKVRKEGKLIASSDVSGT